MHSICVLTFHSSLQLGWSRAVATTLEAHVTSVTFRASVRELGTCPSYDEPERPGVTDVIATRCKSYNMVPDCVDGVQRYQQSSALTGYG